jgi:hypothetical protein
MQGEMRHGRQHLAAVSAVFAALASATVAEAGTRMHGAGSVSVGGTKVTHSLSLDCDRVAARQRLRVRWAGYTFRLTKLTDAHCADGGHTSFGQGTGKLDGRGGHTAYWRAVDGRDADRLRLEIRDAEDRLVLDVGERVLRDGAHHVPSGAGRRR